jgi:hypothetical protein
LAVIVTSLKPCESESHQYICVTIPLTLVPSLDCYFWDDLFAVITSATALLSLSTDHAGRLNSVQLCLRAARALKTDSSTSRGGYSKSVRIVTTCEACAVCIKVLLHLLVQDSTTLEDPSAAKCLEVIEECLATLLKWPAALERPSFTHSVTDSPTPTDLVTAPLPSRSPTDSQQSRHLNNIWTLLAVAMFGLRECRRWDAFEFRSVYRLSRTVFKLSGILTQYPELQPVSYRVLSVVCLDSVHLC